MKFASKYTILKTQLVKGFRKIIGIHPRFAVIGDSHCQSFIDADFKIFHLGPATAFGLGNEKSKTGASQTLEKLAKSLPYPGLEAVIFVFGEIDCRLHIFNQYETEKRKYPLELIAERSVLRYVRTVDKIFRHKNLEIMLLSVVPPGEQGNIYGYSFYPDMALRVKITKIFNHLLNKYAQKYNMSYIDLFNHVSNQNGLRLKKYIFDEVHLNSNICQVVKKLIYEKV